MSVSIKVGMADFKVAKSPDKLSTLGLGSCVGVCLYDSTRKIGGMAHIMLPDSKLNKLNSNPAKFADTCIDLLLEQMVNQGAIRRNLVCKIAGGAQMFASDNQNDLMRIGFKNAEAVRKIMTTLGIPIIADDTGGNFGRTIELDTSDGMLYIRTIGHGVKEV